MNKHIDYIRNHNNVKHLISAIADQVNTRSLYIGFVESQYMVHDFQAQLKGMKTSIVYTMITGYDVNDSILDEGIKLNIITPHYYE